MKIYYGVNDNSIDVTNICMEKLNNDNIITIPSGDLNRANYFTDPLPGVHKKIIIHNDNDIKEFDEYTQIKINTVDNSISIINNTSNKNEINTKIEEIHSKLKIKYGNFKEELPEQKMVTQYLTGNEKVLEIGGNIGRNSLVIAAILASSSSSSGNDTNLVTLESDENIAKQLTENRDLNNFNFHIECSALSKRKLIQKDWNTKPSDILEKDHKWVNTITLDDLKSKYNIEFDTLVLDCEGAFYYILMDMPEILNNINLIIMENDYHNIEHKRYVDNILYKYGFKKIYSKQGGWGPCQNFFFETWSK